MARGGKLARITRADLEPVWSSRLTLDQIGKALGVTGQAISHKARRLGLPPRAVGERPRQIDEGLFRRMWLAGVNSREMADHFGYKDGSAICRKRREMNLPARTRSKGARGTRSTWAQTIPIVDFWQIEYAHKMREAA